MKELIQWVIENKELVATGLILPVLLLLETIVMLTPTKTDDGFMERVGKFVRGALEKFGLPNKLKADKKEEP